MSTTDRTKVLEPAASEFARLAARPPTPRQLGPVAARSALEALQDGPLEKPDVESTWIAVGVGATSVRVHVVRPPRAYGAPLPVVLYLHGGGWVLGSARTHDRLARELAVGGGAGAVLAGGGR